MTRFFTPLRLILGLTLIAYIWLVHERVSPYVGGSDSSGYYNNALLFSEGRIIAEQRTLPGLSAEKYPFVYVPLGFTPRPNGSTIIPTYPIGLSLLTLPTAAVTGWDWVAGWTAGWHLLLGIFLFYPLAREFGLSKGWSLFGTAILATSPLYLAMGLQYMSDVPALAWCEAAMLFALLSWRHAAWSLAAGAAFAIAVLVRPTNALLLLPLVVTFGINWRRWLCFGVGGLPGGIIFGAYNFHAYGGILTSGYGNIFSAFSWVYVIPSLKNYGVWMPLLFTPLTALFLMLPAACRAAPRKIVILILWSLTFFALYSAYDCTPSAWWYLRFILPGVPPVIIGALSLAQRWSNQHNWTLFSASASRKQQLASALLVILSLSVSGVMTRRLNILNGKPDDRSYYKTAEWLNQNAPGGSCVLTMQSSGSIFAYTPYTVIRWDALLSDNRQEVIDSVARNRRNIYAVLYPFEEQEAFTRYPGKWREVFSYRWAKIWLLEPPETSPPTS